MNLIYDGSYNGFLCCVFEIYQRRIKTVRILKHGAPADLFQTELKVDTNPEKAFRVMKRLTVLMKEHSRTMLYWSFLSELPGIENHLLEVIRYTLTQEKDIMDDLTHNSVLELSQTWKKVAREKHRFEAFVRFELAGDNFYFAPVDPDFNVLPIILPHFQSRYAAQDWLIYDTRRDFGVFYNSEENSVSETRVDFSKKAEPVNADTERRNEEKKYRELWQNYFNSVNIPARKNLKLHIKHVPKRYWKYLTEKKEFS